MTRFLLLLCMTSCAAEQYTSVYAVSEKAPSLNAVDIEELEHMGPTLIDGGINFSVYSENAERLEVLIFEDPESERPTQRIEMTPMGDVWNTFVEGVGVGTHYGYIAWGPNWVYDPEWIPGSTTGFRSDVDRFGNRFDPNKLLSDPWSKAIHRDHGNERHIWL